MWLVGLVALAIGAALLAAVLPGSTVFIPGTQLTSGAAFGMSGTISGLAPGVSSTLTVNISNTSLSEPITVTSVTVQATTIPAGCAISNLTVNGAAFTGASPPQVVVSNTSTPPLAASVPSPVPQGPSGTATIAIPIELASSATNPGCQNVTFGFTYQGQGVYTDSTTTSLAPGTPNPSYPGNPVSFTATVNPANASTDTYGPGSASETGAKAVNFFYCTTPSCTPATPLGPATLGTNNQATLSTSAFTSPGTYYIDAQYPGSGSNLDFSASAASNIVTQTVQFSSACVSPPTSGANVILTGTTNGNYTVPSGKSVWLNGGTMTGNVTVPANGSFAATGGAVKGSITSAGPLSLQGTTVSGNVTSTGGGVAMGPGSVLSGNLTDSGAGPVCAVGTSSSPVQISGSISVQNQPTSSATNSFCALTLKTNLTYETNGAPVVIGGSSACPGDTISGNVLVESNTASVTVGGSGYGNTVKSNLTVESNAGTVTVYGNTVSGSIAVESNTVGGGTLTSNSTSSNCTLSGNHPPITVPSATSNTAKGTNNCKASG